MKKLFSLLVYNCIHIFCAHAMDTHLTIAIANYSPYPIYYSINATAPRTIIEGNNPHAEGHSWDMFTEGAVRINPAEKLFFFKDLQDLTPLHTTNAEADTFVYVSSLQEDSVTFDDHEVSRLGLYFKKIFDTIAQKLP